MKKFMSQFLIFLLPFYFVAAVMGALFYMGYETGELYDFNELIVRQREDHSVLIGMGYNEQTTYYKLTNAGYYRADVIALGTSRVMQFKDGYFRSGFYNCGGAVNGNYDEYLNFLQNLNYEPKVVLLGLDNWVFNDEWNKSCYEYSEYTPISMHDRSTMSMVWSMAQDFARRKWSLSDIEKYDMNYGFNGRIKDEGFLWDGSYYYGNVYREPERQPDYMFANTFNRIAGGYARFEWGESIDDATCEHLEALLKYCRENGIEVIGFVPPLAPSVYSRMIESSNYGYLSEIAPVCEVLFEKYGFCFFDYIDGVALNVDDTYFVDGFHGSEVVYAYLIRSMLDSGSGIDEYIDENKLDEMLEDRYDNFQLCDFIH